jgi:hypothetical protein
MREPFGIVNLAPELRQSLNLGFAEPAGVIDAVEDQAGRGIGIGERVALGVPRHGRNAVSQKHRALRRADNLGPVAWVATRIKDADF